MPVNDWFQHDAGLHRTMCPQCGEDANFSVQATWGPKIYGDTESRYRKFLRHESPAGASEELKPVLKDDSPVTCGSCGQVFAYVDGRQAYADYERESIESTIVPSSSDLPLPSLRVYQDSKYHCTLSVPVIAYDIIHQTGIGNRGVSAFTSLVYLLADTQVSFGASWAFERPHIDYRTPGREQGPSLKVDLADIQTPIGVNSIEPHALMAITRTLYGGYLDVAEKHGDEVDYDQQEPSDSYKNVEISVEEANWAIDIMKEVEAAGIRAREALYDLTDSQTSYNFMVAKRADGRLAMHISGQPGRIYKTIAKRAGLELSAFQGDSWRWEEQALADPTVLRFHGMAFCYKY